MKFGLFASAASGFVAAGLADSGDCARAPVIISALTAADIIRVLTILGLQRRFGWSRKGVFPCRGTTREGCGRSPTLELTTGAHAGPNSRSGQTPPVSSSLSLPPINTG